MLKKKKTTAIILMAGKSSRYNKNINKNLELIKKKPLFMYSLDVFYNNKNIDKIILVVKKEDLDEVNKDIKGYENVLVLESKSEREASLVEALNNTDTENVIIHDGARPVIKASYIDALLNEIKKYKGVTMGVISKDNIKICNSDEEVLRTPKRANTWVVQHPQCFNREVLLDVMEKDKTNTKDDALLLEKYGYIVKVVEGDYSNIKVTTLEDLEKAKKYLDEG